MEFVSYEGYSNKEKTQYACHNKQCYLSILLLRALKNRNPTRNCFYTGKSGTSGSKTSEKK